ncbi:MAG TPA: MMPL family transporter [Polyangiaceae bacterium]
MVKFIQRVLTRLVQVQVARPHLILAIALLSMLPAGLLVRRLEVKTGFSELLPDDTPSVVEMRRVSGRLSSMSLLAVTAESKDTALLKRFVDELVPKLRKLPPDLLASVEDGPREAEKFFEKNKHLYAGLDELRQLHEKILTRYDWEVGHKMGTLLDDEEPEPITVQSVQSTFQKSLDQAKASTPGMDGYYIGENGRLAVILIRTPLRAMDQRMFELEARVEELIQAGHYRDADPEFKHGYTGNLVTSAEEYRDITRDLTEVGIAGGILVLLVVYLFFFRVRALLALGISISLGLLWTLAFTVLAIGYLNTATGFLISVIIGNGINAMVIYMARFLEARRDQGLSMPEALMTASLDTWSATLAAVGVAVMSYGALMTTQFRGFRHFGVIGAAGMLLCWLATYTVLPAILSLLERLKSSQGGVSERLGGLYAKPFIWLAKRYAGPLSLFGVVSILGMGAATAAYFIYDPMEYDLSRIRNENTSPSSAQQLSSRMAKIVGGLNQGGRAVLVDRLDQIQPLVTELERRRDSAADNAKPFGEIVSVFSLMPRDQDEKIRLLSEIRDRIDRARKRNLVSDEDYREIEQHLPATLKKVELSDLPDLVVSPFREKNGTIGTILYVGPTASRSVNDLHYLELWADSMREIQLPSGEVIRGTGDPVIFADMLVTIARDAPRVAFLSVLGTAAVVLFAFRGRAGGWVALSTLFLGLTWLIGGLYLLSLKLNFLNFVALPIAIGVGSDYAINVMKRRELEGNDGIERAFTETGGAVVACSMTTLSGYAALMFSVNGAVHSMGITAALGELTTQFSAMLVLPAVLYWFSRRATKRTLALASSAATD